MPGGPPIDKPVRFVCEANLQRIRDLGYCEVCGKYGRVEPHHIKTRGSGGSDHLLNLVAVDRECHDKIHRGLIARGTLAAIAIRREIQ